MKVKIVDEKKEDVKEITIEELTEKEFVGKENNSGKKFALLPTNNGGEFGLFNLKDGWCSCRYGRRNSIKNELSSGRFHYFKTEKKLYLWMAE